MEHLNNPPQWDTEWLRSKYPERFPPFPYTIETNGDYTTFVEVEVAYIPKKVGETINEDTGEVITIYDQATQITPKKNGKRVTMVRRTIGDKVQDSFSQEELDAILNPDKSSVEQGEQLQFPL